MSMRIVILCLLGLVCVGCQTVESSLNYTKGTKALDAGDYDTAIADLEKAVELDPEVARNHINLAAAYLMRGQIQEGWPHARKGVILAPRDTVAQTNFRHYFKSLIDRGACQGGRE